jgi:hypothetical protein
MSHTRLAALLLALAACSGPRLAAAHETARTGPYSVELVDEAGRQLPTFHHRGRTYVLGNHGRRYMLRIRNQSGGRIEVVASVDGRDVIDGKPASVSKAGYLVQPWGEVVIDGFRLSHEAVAAFRFSTVEASYAARMGDARDVGVVGVAVFTEAPPPSPPVPMHEEPMRSQAEKGSAQPPAARSAPADQLSGSRAEEKRERPGLGTGFGERRDSAVVEVAFERAGPAPAAVLSLRYDDRPGLLAMGIDVDGRRVADRERWTRETAEPFRGDGFAEPPPGWTAR